MGKNDQLCQVAYQEAENRLYGLSREIIGHIAPLAEGKCLYRDTQSTEGKHNRTDNKS